MTETNEPTVNIDDLIPDLETEEAREIVKRQGGEGNNCIPWADRGIWTCALKQWQFKPSKKQGGPPYFEAKAKILDAKRPDGTPHPSYPPGTETSFIFKMRREGTDKQPNLPERDKARVNRFIRSMFKIDKGDPNPGENEKSEKLRKAGPLDTDAFQFKFTRKDGNTVEQVKKGKDGKIERDANGHPIIENITYSNDYFDAVSA